MNQTGRTLIVWLFSYNIIPDNNKMDFYNIFNYLIKYGTKILN